MVEYNHADANINTYIKQEIAFNAKYKVAYVTEVLSQDNSVIKYKITDLDDNPVNNATIKIVITRPNKHEYNQEVINPSVDNGVYTFPSVKLAQPGRWNVMAKINIETLQRFYNVKADTRMQEAFEY